MVDIDNVVKGLGIAALHLNNLAQKGVIYSALHADADCCIEAIELLKEYQNEKQRKAVIVCPHCGRRVK